MAAREDRIRADLERAEAAKTEAETELAEYQRSSPRPATRPAQIIEEARTRPSRSRQDLIAQAETEAAELRARARTTSGSRPSGRMADLQGRVADLVDRAGREGRRAQPRPRHADRAHRELHQPGREQVDRWPTATASRRTPRRSSRSPRRRADLGEVEDELFRFARAFEAQRRAAHGAHRPQRCRRSGGSRSSRTAHGRQGAATSSVGARRRSSSAPAVAATCPRSSTGSWSSRRPSARTRSPRSAARCRSTSAQRQRLAQALAPGTGKQVEVKVIVDANVLGGIVARIGDTVIDGSVRHRLEQLKETHLNDA